MSFFDDIKLYRGWGGGLAHPASPNGGGGPGRFRQQGPLGWGDSFFSKLPHPDSPAGKHITSHEITKASNNYSHVTVTTLRKGMKHPDVFVLQKKLQEDGYRVTTDGNFGAITELAVRAFQRKKGLLPDGIAGHKTMQALGIVNESATKSITPSHHQEFIKAIGDFIAKDVSSAKKQTDFQLTTSRPASKLSISAEGLRFIYLIEAQKGVSNHLHWPKGASGVTLGPGYDMKERVSPSIVTDMIAIGIDSSSAQKIGEAAGKQGSDAQKFALENKNLVNLSQEQETKLLANIVPSYENIVRRNITVDLLQYEFDALVSFAYNPGGKFKNVAAQINQGNIVEAMKTIKSVVTSKGVVMKGLVNRREKEVSLYLYGHQN